MKTNILSASKDINHEYCCTVVRIGEIVPIEGSDFLGTTLVNGLTIVIRKDQVKEGDIMFYASNQSALSTEFLSVTNQFDMSHRDLNSNYLVVEGKREEIASLRAEGKNEEADKLELETKQMVGFFNQHGQVKMIKLRGVMSMGYLISLNQFKTFCPEIESVNLEEWIDKDFDTVNDKLFIQVYVPKTNEHHTGKGKAYGKFKKFDRMIQGQFAFHYDTDQLNRSMDHILPTTKVTISAKLHGTSAIYGNIKVNVPKWGGIYSKVFVNLPKWLQFTKVGYDTIFSSRGIIKNKYISKREGVDDIWAEYYHILKDFIPNGMTIYGEIVGYMTNGTKMVQKNYDYGCAVGTNKFMPYRITTQNEDGKVEEWNVAEVYDWTMRLINLLGDNASRILPINILYSGTLADLYPEIANDDNWQKNVLEAMKNDSKTFGMEKNEPLCKLKVPREGIVLRIDDDVCKEAFKLKCLKFLKKEADDIDAGTYEDSEVSERYDS